MKVSKYLMAVAAASLATAPAFAAPTNASVGSSVRAAGSAKDGDKIAGGGIIIAVLAAAAVIAGIVVVADNKDKPDSP